MLQASLTESVSSEEMLQNSFHMKCLGWGVPWGQAGILLLSMGVQGDGCQMAPTAPCFAALQKQSDRGGQGSIKR